MAMADVLTAVRELILVNSALPAAFADRVEMLGNRFPGLTEQERADLASIPTARLQVYTRLVLNGEVAMLEWVYPMSMAAIRRLAGVPADQRRTFDRDLIQQMQRWRSWGSDSTRELAALFADFVRSQRAYLVDRWRGLIDLMAMEQAALTVFYAEDVAASPFDGEALIGLSVGELMDQRIIVPPYVETHSLRYDVLRILDTWRDTGALPEDWPAPAGTLAACGRNVDSLMPEWVRLDAADHAALESAGHHATTLETLAEAYVEAMPEADRTDEEALFKQFFTALARWCQAGIVLRPLD